MRCLLVPTRSGVPQLQVPLPRCKPRYHNERPARLAPPTGGRTHGFPQKKKARSRAAGVVPAPATTHRAREGREGRTAEKGLLASHPTGGGNSFKNPTSKLDAGRGPCPLSLVPQHSSNTGPRPVNHGAPGVMQRSLGAIKQAEQRHAGAPMPQSAVGDPDLSGGGQFFLTEGVY